MTLPPAPSTPRHSAPNVPGVRIEGRIGRGGFATVYAGFQVSLQRPVAVKIDSRLLDDERNRRRFLREMAAASRISGHPHVVSLVDAGVLPDGRPYMVMERCDGGNLATLSARGPLLPADAVRIVEAVSSALAAAHAAGVLHRDIKPANILIDAYGTPRLSDFGIAAIQRDENAASVTLEALTPAFAPPEAFNLTEPTASGDVWSMGAVLLTLVTGRGPRQGADGRQLSLPEIMQGLNLPVDTNDPRVPPVLRQIIERAMHPDPARRYRNGAELTQALAAAARELGEGHIAVGGPAVTTNLVAASQVPVAQAPASPPARRPARATALVLVGVILGALLAGASMWAALLLYNGQIPGITAAANLNQTRLAEPPTTQPATPQTQPHSPALSTSSASPVSTPSPSATPESTATPNKVNASGIPYADNMPWPVGTCLNGSVSATGVSTAQKADCDVANWIVFAGGTLDPGTTGGTSTEAMLNDPQVALICSDHYAERAGMELSGSYTIRVLGPLPEKWDAGARDFACVFARD